MFVASNAPKEDTLARQKFDAQTLGTGGLKKEAKTTCVYLGSSFGGARRNEHVTTVLLGAATEHYTLG